MHMRADSRSGAAAGQWQMLCVLWPRTKKALLGMTSIDHLAMLRIDCSGKTRLALHVPSSHELEIVNIIIIIIIKESSCAGAQHTRLQQRQVHVEQLQSACTWLQQVKSACMWLQAAGGVTSVSWMRSGHWVGVCASSRSLLTSRTLPWSQVRLAEHHCIPYDCSGCV